MQIQAGSAHKQKLYQKVLEDCILQLEDDGYRGMRETCLKNAKSTDKPITDRSSLKRMIAEISTL